MNLLRRALLWLDAHWHAHVCQAVARIEAEENNLTSCPMCDGSGLIEKVS